MLSFHHTNNMRLASTLMLMFTPVNRHDLCHKSSKCVVGGLFWSLSLNPPSINLLCVPSVNVRCSTTQHQTMQAKGEGGWVVLLSLYHSALQSAKNQSGNILNNIYILKVLNFFISKIKVSEFYFFLLFSIVKHKYTASNTWSMSFPKGVASTQRIIFITLFF